MSGIIRTAPAMGERKDAVMWRGGVQAIAALPPADTPLRAWYRTGGGPYGNVAAGTLNKSQSPIPGISVINNQPALGGRAAETIEQARQRGPRALHTLDRAVTAADYEYLACQASAGLERALAGTAHAMWPSSAPGTVSLVLVPRPGDGAGPPFTTDIMQQHQVEAVRQRAHDELDARRPIGTRLDVQWCRYKNVGVRTRVMIEPDQDPVRIQRAMVPHLDRAIAPVQLGLEHRAWPFGRTYHVSLAAGIIMAQPGVRHIEGQVDLFVDHAPDHDVVAITQDHFKANTWFVASKQYCYRSTNDGNGWEALFSCGNGRITHLVCNPWVPGALACVIVSNDDGKVHHRVRRSDDYGNTWHEEASADTAFEIEDICWRPGTNRHLLLATDAGLYIVRPRAFAATLTFMR